MSDMLKKAQEVESYVIDMRRYFHENPELSCQEFKTGKDYGRIGCTRHSL